MRSRWMVVAVLTAGMVGVLAASGAQAQDDPVRTLVGRLDLEKYKATIKGLTQFGDRRQGTDRNRAANDWIEAQLKSYGCSDVARITYEYAPAPRTGGWRDRARRPGGGRWRRSCCRAAGGQAAGAQGRGRGGSSPVKGNRGPTGVNNDPTEAAGCDAARAQHAANHAWPARRGLLHEDRFDAP